ncbi:MAG: hypothetical protein R2867_37480 [Caldilineaceae bacterium]
MMTEISISLHLTSPTLNLVRLNWTVVKGPNFNSFAVQAQLVVDAISAPTDRAIELVDYNDDGVADLYVVDKLGASGYVEVTIWDGTTTFQTSLASLVFAQTNIASGDVSWLFRFGKIPGLSDSQQSQAQQTTNGPQDLFAIAKTGLTIGKTGVKVYSGSSDFSSVLGTYTTTVEEYTPQNYGRAFEVGDYNSDGISDLYSFKNRYQFR